jgi:hypothetical protein
MDLAALNCLLRSYINTIKQLLVTGTICLTGPVETFNVIDFDVVHFRRGKVQFNQAGLTTKHIYMVMLCPILQTISQTRDSSYWDQNVLNGMNQLCVHFDCTPPQCET